MLALTTTCEHGENNRREKEAPYTGDIVLNHDAESIPVGYGKGDIRPGKYVSKGGPLCRWELSINNGYDTEWKNTKGDHGGGKHTSVTIGKHDEFFTTKGCGNWRKAVK